MKQSMKWINAKDKLPHHEQEVLMNLEGGAFYIAKFNSNTNCFVNRAGVSFDIIKNVIFWAKLIDPTLKSEGF